MALKSYLFNTFGLVVNRVSRPLTPRIEIRPAVFSAAFAVADILLVCFSYFKRLLLKNKESKHEIITIPQEIALSINYLFLTMVITLPGEIKKLLIFDLIRSSIFFFSSKVQLIFHSVIRRVIKWLNGLEGQHKNVTRTVSNLEYSEIATIPWR